MFGRFEADRPNELWIGDALHGPTVGGRKTYLAFLDDNSRAIMGHRFGFRRHRAPRRGAAPRARLTRGPRGDLRRLCRPPGYANAGENVLVNEGVGQGVLLS